MIPLGQQSGPPVLLHKMHSCKNIQSCLESRKIAKILSGSRKKLSDRKSRKLEKSSKFNIYCVKHVQCAGLFEPRPPGHKTVCMDKQANNRNFLIVEKNCSCDSQSPKTNDSQITFIFILHSRISFTLSH